jgi:hypothetical protein
MSAIECTAFAFLKTYILIENKEHQTALSKRLHAVALEVTKTGEGSMPQIIVHDYS